MPFKHGSTATILLADKNQSALFNDLQLSVDVDTADSTVFSNTWKTSISGKAQATVSGKGYFDTLNEGVRQTLSAASGSVLTYGPAGLTTVGDFARLMTVTDTAYAESMPVGDIVAFNWDALSTDSVGFGYILRPLAVQAGTGNSTGKDDTAVSSTTGWSANLHVSAITDVATWVIKVQDSADNITFADITGAVFTTVSGPTSERLISASKIATVRRYVRTQATRTGGTSPTLTFAVAFSRVRV